MHPGGRYLIMVPAGEVKESESGHRGKYPSAEHRPWRTASSVTGQWLKGQRNAQSTQRLWPTGGGNETQIRLVFNSFWVSCIYERLSGRRANRRSGLDCAEKGLLVNLQERPAPQGRIEGSVLHRSICTLLDTRDGADGRVWDRLDCGAVSGWAPHENCFPILQFRYQTRRN